MLLLGQCISAEEMDVAMQQIDAEVLRMSAEQDLVLHGTKAGDATRLLNIEQLYASLSLRGELKPPTVYAPIMIPSLRDLLPLQADDAKYLPRLPLKLIVDTVKEPDIVPVPPSRPPSPVLNPMPPLPPSGWVSWVYEPAMGKAEMTYAKAVVAGETLRTKARKPKGFNTRVTKTPVR
jgi:hypothetical protein